MKTLEHLAMQCNGPLQLHVHNSSGDSIAIAIRGVGLDAPLKLPADASLIVSVERRDDKLRLEAWRE